MTQKIFCFVLITILSMFTQTYAQTIEVQSLNKFSTENPPQSISVKIMSPVQLSENEYIDSGVTLNGDLIDVVSPKRLKRDASFSFKPNSYTDLDGKNVTITSDITAKFTTHIDKADIAKSAALSVGNHFVKGLSMGVAAVSGAVKNEEGNRLKSSAISAYEASPVSYINKGEDIVIETDQVFLLKFPNVKNKKDENQEVKETSDIEKE